MSLTGTPDDYLLLKMMSEEVYIHIPIKKSYLDFFKYNFPNYELPKLLKLANCQNIRKNKN